MGHLSDDVIKAALLAEKLHRGEIDEAGDPLVKHAMGVMLRLGAGADDNVRVAALLHEAVRHTGSAGLIASGVDSRAALLAVKTQHSDKEGYLDWAEKLGKDGSREELALGWADVSDLADPARTKRVPEKNRGDCARHAKAMMMLSRTYNESGLGKLAEPGSEWWKSAEEELTAAIMDRAGMAAGMRKP